MSLVNAHHFALSWETSRVSLSCFYYSQGSSLVVLDVVVLSSDRMGDRITWYNGRAVFPDIFSVSHRLRETGCVLPSKQNPDSITGPRCLLR